MLVDSAAIVFVPVPGSARSGPDPAQDRFATGECVKSARILEA